MIWNINVLEKWHRETRAYFLVYQKKRKVLNTFTFPIRYRHIILISSLGICTNAPQSSENCSYAKMILAAWASSSQHAEIQLLSISDITIAISNLKVFQQLLTRKVLFVCLLALTDGYYQLWVTFSIHSAALSVFKYLGMSLLGCFQCSPIHSNSKARALYAIN